MTPRFRLTESLDHLQRTGITPISLTETTNVTQVSTSRRRLLHIEGISRPKQLLNGATNSPKQLGSPSESVLVGLFGYKIPVSFLVHGGREKIEIDCGIWSPDNEQASSSIVDARCGVLEALLRSTYDGLNFTRREKILPALDHSGYVLGMPTYDQKLTFGDMLPWDVVFQAMTGKQWAVLILAQPIGESVITKFRQDLLNEMRSVQAEAQSMRMPSPLTEHYDQLLSRFLLGLTVGQSLGAWRTAVYLLGDQDSYYQLASVWRGVFTGEQSLPEPLRVWDDLYVRSLATLWAMSDSSSQHAESLFQHPFEHQTLLTSSQLAAYIHLPQIEVNGFKVSSKARFDTMPPQLAKGETPISVGKIVNRQNSNVQNLDVTDYAVAMNSLKKHVFVAGITGSGKTNTLLHLLQEIDTQKVPFLVIEPAKTEYRAMVNDDRMRDRLRIFTLGDENIAPFRMNPFEVVGWPFTSVAVHLDLLRSVFVAGFGMWTPLPQILEQCLYRVYQDRGWDLTANTNYRMRSQTDVAAAYPTMTDLLAKVDEVTRELGYEQKITDDMRAALRTRLNSLRTGGKGKMLDTQRSLPMEDLLSLPTVLELENVGDDDDKAFLMGLLFIRLVEYRRAEAQREPKDSGDLRHILVIEEAHRLLANVSAHQEAQEANPRGKAVETFASLLSEIRAYGQGIVVADQVPVKLSPDIIKNTSLKIVHKVVAVDDRMVLGGAMAMNDEQVHMLATLEVGRAVVFGEGDDAPLLVQIPRVEVTSQSKPINDDVARHMMGIYQAANSVFRLLPSYVESEKVDSYMLQAAHRIVEDEAFQRLFARIVLSAFEDPNAIASMWDEMVRVVRTRRPIQCEEEPLLRVLLYFASKWLVERRGAQAGWNFGDTAAFTECLFLMLSAHLDGRKEIDAHQQFADLALRLWSRNYDPFLYCSTICKRDGLPVCLYRHAVADLVDQDLFTQEFAASLAADRDLSKQDGMTRKQTFDTCWNAAYQLIQFAQVNDDSTRQHEKHVRAKRVALCLAQHMLERTRWQTDGAKAQHLQILLNEGPSLEGGK